jgi:hypothetical protein
MTILSRRHLLVGGLSVAGLSTARRLLAGQDRQAGSLEDLTLRAATYRGNLEPSSSRPASPTRPTRSPSRSSPAAT